MGLFSKWFGKSSEYDDAQLVYEAQSALSNHPLINDSGSLAVESQEGIMRLGGTVQQEKDRERVEDVVRNALTTKGLKHEQIINELKVPQNAN